MKTAKELAFIYDLYIVPNWREAFDAALDETLKLPKSGRILDAGCGTGTFAFDLAVKMGERGEVIAVEEDDERLKLALGKNSIKNLENLKFIQAPLDSISSLERAFDLAILDVSLFSPVQIHDDLENILSDLKKTCVEDATFIMKTATRGTFDEFFSVFWEALFELDLPAEGLEELILNRVTVDEAEQYVKEAGFREVESSTLKCELLFEDGKSFIEDPIIESYFLDDWLAIVVEDQRSQVKAALIEVIDRTREGEKFDASFKVTLVTATA